MNKAEFERLCPGAFFLSLDCPDELGRYLTARKLIGEPKEVQSVTIAGTGNMNCVLRVSTGKRSLIVKQSRPWVEKFPCIAAPGDRVLNEARFYTAVAECESVAGRMPRLIDCDSESRVIVLQDLGESADFSFLYHPTKSLTLAMAGELCEWLTALHHVDMNCVDGRFSGRGTDWAERDDAFANLEMRRLNHEHIFHFPLDPGNGLRLDEISLGLGECARALQQNGAYVNAVTSLGDIYLESGADRHPSHCLLHGDFFPGSWLGTSAGVRVIDPEFSFCGRAEFDVGVFLAHLHLTGNGPNIQACVRNQYQPAGEFDWILAGRFAGVEIMRRLIGVAQLPLEADLETLQKMLALSQELVLA